MINALDFSKNNKYMFYEKTHTYYFGDQKVNTSVTSFIESNYWPKFDLEYVSQIYAETHNLTQQEVKDMWKKTGDIASTAGTIIHSYLENSHRGKIVDDDYSFVSPDIEQQVKERVQILKPKATSFLEDIKDKLIPLQEEYTVGKKNLIAGNIDLVAWNEYAQEIQIWDYKNAKQIQTSNKWNKCFYPFNAYDDCNYIHYSIQLSMYKALLEDLLNIQVGKLYLVHFNYEVPDNTYNTYQCYDFSNVCRKELERLDEGTKEH